MEDNKQHRRPDIRPVRTRHRYYYRLDFTIIRNSDIRLWDGTLRVLVVYLELVKVAGNKRICVLGPSLIRTIQVRTKLNSGSMS